MDAETSPNTSLRDFLHVIFKRKSQILLFFGLTVCTVAIGAFLATPIYQATAQILVKIGRENMYVPTLPTGGPASPVISVRQEEQINSELEILKSQFLNEKVVESLGPTVLYKDLNHTGRRFLSGLLRTTDAKPSLLQRAVLRLHNDITVKPVETSDVINVSFRHPDPQLAATVVNTLVSVYLDQHLRVHRSPQSYRFFQEQADILRNKLQRSEEELETFKNVHHLTSPKEEQRLRLAEAARLRTALSQNQSQEAETEQRLRQLRQQLASTPENVPLDKETDHNPPVLNNLQIKLAELELQEHDYLTKYKDQSRLVQSIRGEIRIVRKKLAEQAARNSGATRTGINTVYQALQQELLRNEAERSALSAKRDTLRAHLLDNQKMLGNLSQAEIEFNRLQQEVEVDQQNYRLYLTKFEESRISTAMDAEKITNVSLIEPARPPLRPAGPRKKLMIMLAVILGGLGGFGLAFLLEYLDDSLETREDVEYLLDLPVLTSIPKAPDMRTRQLYP